MSKVSCFLLCFLLLGSSACTTYRLAKDIKLVSFEEEATKGKGIGPVRGEDCTWAIFGYWMGYPTLDKAVMNVRDRFPQVRYINHLNTEQTGFETPFVSKRCIVVKGAAYK